MNIEEFWEIIDVGKESEEPENILKEQLLNRSASDLESFQAHFDSLFDEAYTWKLWGAAYIIGGGCSDDGFIDFRYGLLSKGKKIFENALSDPETLAELGEDPEIFNELFGYVAQDVFEQKTGNEIRRAPSTPSDESMGEEWDFDDENENKRRLPTLMSLHW